MRSEKRFVLPALALAVTVALALTALSTGCGPNRQETVVVGSKHFTEQRILGEIAAQLIEARTDLAVTRKIGLQGTKVCFSALREGGLDLYPEYTGTGLVNLLEEAYDPDKTPEEIRKHVAAEFQKRWGIVWLDPLGFANTYAYAMREEQAQKLGIRTISDLKPHADTLKPGFDHEYTMRPEYKRFAEVYGFSLAEKVTKLDPDITYKAVKDRQVDLIDAFSTDGRIAAYNLRVLEDDKHLFPPYDACITVRRDTFQAHPELREVLGMLAGAISAEEMRQMNYAVNEELKSPAAVARAFLEKKGWAETP
jgi:glycine betaine/choline ABC-type transport system substrate-binding protein